MSVRQPTEGCSVGFGWRHGAPWRFTPPHHPTSSGDWGKIPTPRSGKLPASANQPPKYGLESAKDARNHDNSKLKSPVNQSAFLLRSMDRSLAFDCFPVCKPSEWLSTRPDRPLRLSPGRLHERVRDGWQKASMMLPRILSI